MGLTMKDDGSSCIKPSLFGATDRPVPTLDPSKDHLIFTASLWLMFKGVKQVVGIMNKIGSLNLIFILLFVIIIFFLFCVFDILRIIQLNEEVALVCGYSLLLVDWTYDPQICVLASVSIQFFFTAAFVFFLLECQ